MTKQPSQAAVDPAPQRSSEPSVAPASPFTIRFGLLMIALTTFVMPIVFFMPFLIAELLGVPLAKQLGMTPRSFGVLVLISQSIGLLLSLVLISKRLKKAGANWSAVGMNLFKPFQAVRYISGYYLLLFGLLLAFSIVAVSLGVEVPERPTDERGGTEILRLMGSFWLTFILSVILAPIIEEIIFRGVLFPVLTKRFGLIAGVIGSSLLFTVIHLDPIQMMSALPLGIYLAVMAHRTKSIYPGMILHATWNLLVLLIAQAAV